MKAKVWISTILSLMLLIAWGCGNSDDEDASTVLETNLGLSRPAAAPPAIGTEVISFTMPPTQVAGKLIEITGTISPVAACAESNQKTICEAAFSGRIYLEEEMAINGAITYDLDWLSFELAINAVIQEVKVVGERVNSDKAKQGIYHATISKSGDSVKTIVKISIPKNPKKKGVDCSFGDGVFGPSTKYKSGLSFDIRVDGLLFFGDVILVSNPSCFKNNDGTETCSRQVTGGDVTILDPKTGIALTLSIIAGSSVETTNGVTACSLSFKDSKGWVYQIEGTLDGSGQCRGQARICPPGGGLPD
jgi:hypothetical protein